MKGCTPPLQVSSMQLMDNYCPCAAGLLVVLVPVFEPLGLAEREADSLMGFDYTPAVTAAIAATAVLGLLVSLSTFLVIGATSSLTYNVVRAQGWNFPAPPGASMHSIPQGRCACGRSGT